MHKTITSEVVYPSSHSIPPWISSSLLASIKQKTNFTPLLGPLADQHAGQFTVDVIVEQSLCLDPENVSSSIIHQLPPALVSSGKH